MSKPLDAEMRGRGPLRHPDERDGAVMNKKLDAEMRLRTIMLMLLSLDDVRQQRILAYLQQRFAPKVQS